MGGGMGHGAWDMGTDDGDKGHENMETWMARPGCNGQGCRFFFFLSHPTPPRKTRGFAGPRCCAGVHGLGGRGRAGVRGPVAHCSADRVPGPPREMGGGYPGICAGTCHSSSWVLVGVLVWCLPLPTTSVYAGTTVRYSARTSYGTILSCRLVVPSSCASWRLLCPRTNLNLLSLDGSSQGCAVHPLSCPAMLSRTPPPPPPGPKPIEGPGLLVGRGTH